MSEANNLSSRGKLIISLMCVALGIIIVLGVFDVGPLSADKFNVPPWVGVATGAVFLFAGLALLAQEILPWLNSFMAAFALISMALIIHWVAFGAGGRTCSGGIGGSLSGVGIGMSGLGCRIQFGIGAVIMDVVLIYWFAWALQKFAGGSPRLAQLMKWAEWLVLLVLSPLLLVLFLPAIFKTVMTRLRTGKWPRNEAFIRRQREKGLLRDKDDG